MISQEHKRGFIKLTCNNSHWKGLHAFAEWQDAADELRDEISVFNFIWKVRLKPSIRLLKDVWFHAKRNFDVNSFFTLAFPSLSRVSSNEKHFKEFFSRLWFPEELNSHFKHVTTTCRYIINSLWRVQWENKWWRSWIW